MRPLRPSYLALLAALVTCPVRAQSVDEPFTLEVDSTTIVRSGARRISDVLQLAGPHFGSSMDGFRFAIDPGALSPPAYPGWRVRLDGVPVTIGGPFDLHPELIPAVGESIHRVTVTTAPSSGPGGLSAGGWIDVETTPPPQGLQLSGFVSAGNEVGDPGPFRYTSEATPNADRIGPVYGVRGSVRADSWWFEGAFRADQIHMTDPFILDRVNLLYRGFRRPRLLLTSPKLSIAHIGRDSRHRFSLGVTALRDLRFTPETGTENPLLARDWFFGAAGDDRLSSALRFHYTLDARQQDLFQRSPLQNPDNDLILARIDGEVGFTMTGRYGSMGLSGGIRQHWLRIDQWIVGRATSVPYARMDADWTPGPRWSHRVAVQADGSDEDPARPRRVRFSVIWQQRVGNPARSTFDLGLAWLTTMPETTETPWLWMVRGWTAPVYPVTDDEEPSTVVVPSYLTDHRTMTIDADLRIRRGASYLAVGGFGRLFRGQNLPWMEMVPDPAGTPRYVTNQRLKIGVEGYVVGGRARLHHAFSRSSSQRFDVTWTRPVPGQNETFWAQWKQRPELETSWTLSAEPATRTSMFLQFRYRSASLWPWIRVPWLLPGEMTRIPPRVDASATFSKRLWGDRLLVVASFEHLLNVPLRTHPLGESDRLTLHLGATAFFGYTPRE